MVQQLGIFILYVLIYLVVANIITLAVSIFFGNQAYPSAFGTLAGIVAVVAYYRRRHASNSDRSGG
jgi:hypothetical protein